MEYLLPDIIEAIIYLEAENSFKTLSVFLENARSKWGYYQTLSYAYIQTINGILKLDKVQALTLIMKHVSEKAASANDEYKEFLIDAIDQVEDDGEFTKLIKEIILEGETSSQTNLYTLKSYETRGLQNDQDFYLGILDNITKTPLVEEEASEEDSGPSLDVEFIDITISKLLKLAKASEDLKETVWQKIYSFIKGEDKVLKATILDLLRRKLVNKSFDVNNEYLFKIFMTIPEAEKLLFTEALYKRFRIGDEEKELLAEVEGLVTMVDKSGFDNLKGMITLLDGDHSFELPVFNQKSAEVIKPFYINHAPGPAIKSILGADAAVDKFFLLKEVSLEIEHRVITIDVDSMMFAPDKISEVTKKLLDDKKDRGILYYHNSKEFFDAYRGPEGSTKELALNLFAMIKTFALTENFKVMLSIEHSYKALETSDPELYGMINDADQFEYIMDLGEVSAEDRKAIFDFYKERISHDRVSEISDFNEVVQYTDNLAPYSFTSYILNYFKISLLTHGRLISLHTYNKYLDELKKEEEQEAQEAVEAA